MITAQPLRHAVSDQVADALWADSQGTDEFLRELRRRGAFKVESIGSLKRVANIPLGKAKDLVHFSVVWADTRQADENLHENLIEALGESGWSVMEESQTAKHAS